MSFQWALAYVGLRQFLRPCGSSGEGRLDFHHRTISKVVRKMFLNEKTNIVWWHRRMAEYFSTWYVHWVGLGLARMKS